MELTGYTMEELDKADSASLTIPEFKDILMKNLETDLWPLIIEDDNYKCFKLFGNVCTTKSTSHTKNRHNVNINHDFIFKNKTLNSINLIPCK